MYLPFHRFRGLQNYTTLKLARGIEELSVCFRGLQNYTTLKPCMFRIQIFYGFRGLQNYTTLKRKKR